MIVVYVIQSETTLKKLYVGQTQNMVRRLSEHNHGRSKYTQTWSPWKVIYTEIFADRPAARIREKYLKSTAGKNYLRKIKVI